MSFLTFKINWLANLDQNDTYAMMKFNDMLIGKLFYFFIFEEKH